MSKLYDQRFDLALRQDVKDWARTAGISEADALKDVLEQRKASAAARAKHEPEYPTLIENLSGGKGGNSNGQHQPTDHADHDACR